MFKIYGSFQGFTEVIDEFSTKKEAEKMLIEYRMAMPSFSLWIKKGGKDV